MFFKTEKSAQTDFSIFSNFRSIFLQKQISIERNFSILFNYMPTTIKKSVLAVRLKLGFRGGEKRNKLSVFQKLKKNIQ